MWWWTGVDLQDCIQLQVLFTLSPWHCGRSMRVTAGFDGVRSCSGARSDDAWSSRLYDVIHLIHVFSSDLILNSSVFCLHLNSGSYNPIVSLHRALLFYGITSFAVLHGKRSSLKAWLTLKWSFSDPRATVFLAQKNTVEDF